MWKFIKFLIGICSLPLCWSISIAVYQLHQGTLRNSLDSSWEAWALPMGFLVWTLVFFLLPKPTRTYVLGHELTHAFWALMMGGRVGRIKVGSKGGHVELSKTNFLITLAPYFFPLYTFLVIGAYYVCGFFMPVEPYRAWWLGAVGFTWSFHITFTIQMLSQRQPDVQEHGRLFSYSVIYFMNLLLIGLWMAIVGSPQLSTFWELFLQESLAAYGLAGHWMSVAWNGIRGLIDSAAGGS